MNVPDALLPEERAPDSIQFNLMGMDDAEVLEFVRIAGENGVKVQVFGASQDNARAFWNWKFLGPAPDLPQTRKMLMRACDTRLPARLQKPDLDLILAAMIGAVDAVMGNQLAYGT